MICGKGAIREVDVRWRAPAVAEPPICEHSCWLR